MGFGKLKCKTWEKMKIKQYIGPDKQIVYA